MRAVFRCLKVAGLCCVLTGFAILLVGTINSSALTVAQASSDKAEQVVNRTAKGDRRLLRASSSRPKQPERSSLPEGCEPLVSPIADRALARIAVRCLS